VASSFTAVAVEVFAAKFSMKKLDTVLKEYTARLSVDNLKYLTLRLEDRIGADLAEALNAMSTCSDLDNWLSSAKSHAEFYDMVDNIQEYCQRELSKRLPELQQV
jgi:hypothetical protein